MDGEAGRASTRPSNAPDAERDADARAHPGLEAVDAFTRQAMARTTFGASPLAFLTAGFDWAAHIGLAPGKQAALGLDAAAIWMRALQAGMTPPAPKGAVGSFQAPGPRALRSAFNDFDALVDSAVDVPGVSKRHKDMMRFAARAWLDYFRPENNLFTNEEAFQKTIDERGANLLRGWAQFLRDFNAEVLDAPAPDDGPTSQFRIGETLAATPGSVIYRNELFELIQYTPQTPTVKAEPILITPAWIMKYYILDLSERNSLVGYLVREGFTVFMMSWRNPGPAQRECSLDDYRVRGVHAALAAIANAMPDVRVHLLGYCLGGTLASITAAALARNGADPIKTLSLLAAQTDFRDAGELSLFIDEDQLSWLEASMETHGYLDADQMASAFQMLRARDLIWRRWQHTYLMGEGEEMFDLLAWNRDTTRMPQRMHAEYLRKLFLNNDFVQGRLEVDGRPIAISDIRAPIFALGTEKDHVAPWRSVYKIHLFADTSVTFVLANGGHNAGVVSEPGKPHRRHRVATKSDAEYYVGPDAWMEKAEPREGSWWPTWRDWLLAQSSGDRPAPTPVVADAPGNFLSKDATPPQAPGEYVFEK